MPIPASDDYGFQDYIPTPKYSIPNDHYDLITNPPTTNTLSESCIATIYVTTPFDFAEHIPLKRSTRTITKPPWL